MKFSSSLFAVALALIALPAVAATSGGSSTPPSCPGDQPVWVTTKSKAYHLANDPLYGKTSHGTYMCKAAADAAGDHLAKGGSSSKGSSSMASPSAMASPSPMASAGATSGKHHKRKSGSSASPAPSPTAS